MAQLLVVGSGGGSVPAIIGPLRTVYIEPPLPTGRGNDATGVRGDASKPFATLTAAMNAMQNGDVLSLSAGIYAPPAGPIPVALLQGVIVAPDGPTQTIIDGAGTGLSCLDFTGAPRELWQVRGVRLNNDPGALCIEADGTGQPANSYFANGRLALGEVTVTGGDMRFRYCGTVILGECVDVVTGGLFEIDSCNFVFFLDSVLFGGRTMRIVQDNDNPLAPNNAGAQQLLPIRFNGGCVYSGGTITLAAQGGLYAAPGSVMPTITADTLAAAVVNPAYLPSLEVLGQVGSLDFTNAPAQWPTGSALKAPGATFTGSVGISGSPGANGLSFDGTEASYGTTVDIGEGVRGNLRDSSFKQGILASLTCNGVSGAGVIPPTFAMGPEVVASPTVFNLPFALVGDQYAVAVDIDDGNAGVCATTNRTSTNFQVQPQAAQGNMRAIVSYYGN